MAGQYNALDRGKEEIRLLRFSSCRNSRDGSGDSSECQMIACEMRIFSLLDKPAKIDLREVPCGLRWKTPDIETEDDYQPHWRYSWGDYVALSYTWSDPLPTNQIIVNDRVVMIRSNLEAALRALLLRPAMQLGLWVWVDALCINQNDFLKRAEEVPRMRTIYESAWTVVIWLGESKDDSDLAMKLIKILAKWCEDGSVLLLSLRFSGVGTDAEKHVDLDFSPTRWSVLDEDMSNLDAAVELVGYLLRVAPPLLFCIIVGLRHIDTESNSPGLEASIEKFLRML